MSYMFPPPPCRRKSHNCPANPISLAPPVHCRRPSSVSRLHLTLPPPSLAHGLAASPPSLLLVRLVLLLLLLPSFITLLLLVFSLLLPPESQLCGVDIHLLSTSYQLPGERASCLFRPSLSLARPSLLSASRSPSSPGLDRQPKQPGLFAGKPLHPSPPIALTRPG